MTIPVMVALLFSVKSLGKKAWLTIALLLSVFALLWTYTRSAWIGALCALAMFGMLRGKKWALLFLLLILLSGLLMLQPELLDKSYSMFRANDEERIFTWVTTLDMIRDHPLTGIGKRNYSKHIQPYRQQRYSTFEFSSDAHAHNNILQVTADSGIVAGICFVWLWGVVFWNMYRTYRRIPENHAEAKWLILGFFGALIAFFVQGLFEHNFGDTESAMMMWLYMSFGLKLQALLSTHQLAAKAR
jgi:O-antigen ligase